MRMTTFCGRLVALLLTLGFAAARRRVARRQPDARRRAREASPPTPSADTEAAIAAVAASGNAARRADHRGAAGRPAAVRRRRARRSIIQRRAGRVLDAATGAAVRRRRAGRSQRSCASTTACAARIDAALGGLTLLSPDPAQRLAAAQAVFKSRDASGAAGARHRARQGDRRARQARADRGARRRHSLPGRRHRGRQARRHRRHPRPRRPGRARAARPACRPTRRLRCSKRRAATRSPAIQIRLAFWEAVQNAWYGLSLGSVLLLAAIGLAITFGVMGVINMAHGEMVMLGAYTTFVVQEMIRAHNPGLFDYSLPIAIPLAFLVAGVVGILIERSDHPLPLRPPAGDAARHLGPVADPAAGGAHHLRPDQPRGRHPVLDERRLRASGSITITYNRLWIIVLHAGRVRRAARRCCASPASAWRCAR